jgi:RNA polymerase sigma factor (sigma-70 family)
MTTETLSVAEQFELIYRKFHGRIRSLFYSWLNDWTTSEDLAADVFAALWRDMAQRGLKLDEVEHLYGFLVQRARWVKASYYQSLCARREQPLHNESLDDDAADKSHTEARAATDGPEETIPQRVDVWRILSKLPDKQRRALVLRYYDDLNNEGVGRVTGWPPRTVHYHTANALNRLRVAAGMPAGDSVHTTAPARREAMRRTYLSSIEAGTPLSMAELARRFGRTSNVAKQATAGIERPERIVPKYQVRDHVREGLRNGTYPPGSMMPPVGQLAAKFDTSHGNVCGVFSELAAEGLLVKVTGPGYGAHGRWHAAPVPVPALVTNTYLATAQLRPIGSTR